MFPLEGGCTPGPICWVPEQCPRSPEIARVVGGALSKKKNSRCDLRGTIQNKIDKLDVLWLHHTYLATTISISISIAIRPPLFCSRYDLSYRYHLSCISYNYISCMYIYLICFIKISIYVSFDQCS